MRLKSIVSSSIGNIMEWYDFGLFAVYTPLFSRLFFPSFDPHIALISLFGLFAIGFFCRPIGAILFGYLGDKIGRAKTLRLTVLMITLPTLLIGFLPTYASIGIAAPILLMLIRIWQGISLGGGFCGNVIYLAETAPTQHRAVISSLAGTGANLGILLAAMISFIVNYYLDEPGFLSIGWRIPYLLSGFLCLFIYFTRLQMQETPVFNYLVDNQLLVKNPLFITLRHHFPEMLRTMGLICMGSTFYYLCFLYMPNYLINNLHYTFSNATMLITILTASMLLLVPIAGMICDRFGRRKMLLFNAALISIIAIPGFYFLQGQYYLVIIAILCLFTFASSLEQGTTSVSVVENYPTPARYTGLSLGYNIGVAIFGGTAPLVCEWLISKTHLPIAPAFYVVLCALITGSVVYFFVHETKGNSLIQS